MTIKAKTVAEYISLISEDKKESFIKLRKSVKNSIPKGFEETISYGMVSYVVPHSIYPEGYHCDPKQPLPFISIAAQKNFIALYHMGIYADKSLLDWFTEEYKKVSKTKLDMGKSCIRFKKPEQIPFELIEKLVSKITPQSWVELYKKSFNK